MSKAMLVRRSDLPVADPVRGRWFKRSAWLLALAAVVAVLASPWGQEQVQSMIPTGAAEKETGADPGSQKVPDLVVCLGYVDSESGVIALMPRQAGRVLEILVKENEEVTAGSPLLRLDDTTARLQVQEAKASLAAAKAQRAKAVQGKNQHAIKIALQQAALEAAGFKVSAAKHNLKARQKELEIKSIGKNQHDPILLEEVATLAEQIKELQAQEKIEKEKLKDFQQHDPAIEIDLMQAEVAKMEAKVLQTQKILEEHTLTAPLDGRIFRVLVAPGELLGVSEKKIAMQFCPKGPLLIRAEVDQSYAKSVQVDQPVLIEDDMHPENNWKGKVKSLSKWYTQKRLIAQEKFQLKDARTLECIIIPDDDQCPLLIGQRVRVTIQPPKV